MITYEHFYFLDDTLYPRHHIDTILDGVVISHSGDEIPPGATLITESEANDALVAYKAAAEAAAQARQDDYDQLLEDAQDAFDASFATAMVDLAATGVIEPTLTLLATSAGDIARRQILGDV